jgi:hypothetical protein
MRIALQVNKHEAMMTLTAGSFFINAAERFALAVAANLHFGVRSGGVCALASF